ncbi:hypothetical protein [Nocardia jinanensis]|uniref:Exonuclease domain-containing protein n=1 Tax=Nocardia jinanensis TaxID=382504 RepID=A0A917W0K2_9NOCA|nr:hypothetical protein [Nocardia jinanensis]GGL46694.1 hypothetical protein GCM10011588_71950 [Nocardia jinanensis]
MTSTLNFAAFDVETANPKYSSICAIGIAIVRNGVRVDTHSWLCRPPEPVHSFNPAIPESTASPPPWWPGSRASPSS